MSDSSRHNYEYDIDLASDVAPAQVIRMVGTGKRVLEIGAGPGSITRHLSGTLGCDVCALEIDPSAIHTLTQFARKVYSLDLNDPSWAHLVKAEQGKFDVVIAADVLEHVYDPWTVLGGMKSLLNDTGSVILSVPHVGHAAIVGCLFDEDFEYRPWGLLDKTHIRFFGMKNIQQLYDSQGLSIEETKFVVRTPEMTEFARRWSRLPADLQRVAQRNRFSHVFQVVSRAVPLERADANLRLMDLDVPPPSSKAVEYWTNAMRHVASSDVEDPSSTLEKDSLPDRSSVKLIAFYLTQFHPIPENDRWWGKGFTEWTNVTKAAPLYSGHYQPHLPTDLGFYDLRVPEVRRAQIELAKAHGIDGFCYHYYWFGGKRLLEKPLDDMLADPDSDMPFCLCWANENWTRRWDAAEHDILIEQTYGPDADRRFITDIMKYLNDPRYIKFNDAPFIIVYRPQSLPDCQETLRIWREYCASQGFPKIHIACALTHGNWDWKQRGFDSGVEFPPHNMKMSNLSKEVDFFRPFHGYCTDYANVAERYLTRQYGPDANGFRTVFPSWDNTARKNDSAVFVMNGTPQNYEFWLSRAITKTAEEFPGQERFVFINAWNEWAEGCHLEPDRKFGHRFLQATMRAKQGSSLRYWTHKVALPRARTISHVAVPSSGPAEASSQPLVQKSWIRRSWRKVKRAIRPASYERGSRRNNPSRERTS